MTDHRCKGCAYHVLNGCSKGGRDHSPHKERGGCKCPQGCKCGGKCGDACKCKPCKGCCSEDVPAFVLCRICGVDPCACRSRCGSPRRERSPCGTPCGNPCGCRGRGCMRCCPRTPINDCNLVCVTNPGNYLVSPPCNINLRYVTFDNATCTPVCLEVRKCPQRCGPIYLSPKFGLPLGTCDDGRLRYGEPCCNNRPDLGIPSAPSIHLGPGESQTVGVNTIGQDMQIVNIICPSTGKLLGPPATLQTNANSFVVYDTCGVFHLSAFKMATYRASY